jgi:hypothetical protein
MNSCALFEITCFHLILIVLYGLVPMLTQAAGVGLPVPTGVWGGEHISLVVTETGATVGYDCAVGRIDGPLPRSQEGDFEARGVHVFERGGPGRLGDPAPTEHPAQYQGWTDGRHMRLTVILSASGKELGTFSLELGRQPLLEKCL